MKIENTPWIKLKEYLDHEDYELISHLQELCVRKDGITLKLELDYKLGAAVESTGMTGLKQMNEFMYFTGQQLVGYIGISQFGGQGSPMEITGMVHPEFRRQGIFTQLYALVTAERKRRNAGDMLMLCDRTSLSGQSFVKKTGAAYRHSEYEMVFRKAGKDRQMEQGERGDRLVFRKADNADAEEIARQNAIYFGEAGDTLLPEEEEKRGMTIYLAEKAGATIGKFHLQMSSGAGGIFGLGVLPEHQGQGFGRELLLQAVEKLQEAKMKDIFLQVAADNARALQLYKSCGFQETSIMDYFEAAP